MSNYKKVSELGLELIELEDQILLVDRDLNRGDNTQYYLNGFIGTLYTNPKYQSYDILDFDRTLVERVRIESGEVPYRIIASAKQLEGLPLLVIEDGIRQLALKECNNMFSTALAADYWEKGYNKAHQTYKFTEEDLKRVLEFWGERGRYDKEGFTCSFEKWWDQVGKNSIKSLTKKELWVNVHDRCKCGTTCEFKECRHEQKLKITDNQIKAVWK